MPSLESREGKVQCDSVNGGNTGCWDAVSNPSRRGHRYLALIVLCFLNFGNSFCYENPAALQEQILRSMHVDGTQFTLLNSVYSWPNVALAFMGGVLIDRFLGIRWGGILFSGILIFGQVLVSLGALTNHYWLMVFGRFIFGLGGESLIVVESKYIATWYPDNEMSFVFGLVLSISRLGSTTNMIAMVSIYKYFTSTYPSLENYQILGLSLFIGALVCAASMWSAVVMAVLDKRASRILKKGQTKIEKVNLKDVKHFTASYWLLVVVCFMFYAAFFPFINLALVFFQSKFELRPTSAAVANSLIYLISTAASPVFGLVVGLTGKEMYWLWICLLLMLLNHVLLGFTFLTPFLAISLLGMSFSIVNCTLWPMVALIIPKKVAGTAYGVMLSFQNLGLALAFIVTGVLVDHYGYLMLEVFFCFCVIVSFFSAVVLHVVEKKRSKSVLNMTCKKRVLFLSKLRAG